MIPLIKDFDTRDLLAIGIVGAFIAAAFVVTNSPAVDALSNMALIVLGFFFGTKAALDTSPAAPASLEPPALVSMPCPYIAAANAANCIDQAVIDTGAETLGEVL